MYRPTLQEVKTEFEAGMLIPVYREVVADLETPVSAFLKVAQGGPSCLLESVSQGQQLARYSFIGVEPYRMLRSDPGDAEGPLERVAVEMGRYQVATLPDLPRFSGGAVGYLSYEAVRRFEEIPAPDADPLDLPEAMFMFYDTLVVFDHVTHKIKVVSHVRPGGDTTAAYAEATGRIEEIIARLRRPLQPRPEATGGKRTTPKMTSNFSQPEFEAAVIKIKDYISAGDAIQVVLSQRMARPTDAAPFDIYRALRSVNPSPYMFYLDFEDFQIIGASPEMLVRVEEGAVMTRPLAGTRPRGQTPEEDAALEKELHTDEKECAEHIMLVDLGRNDIGRVATAGSVKVSELMDIERYSHVMHLVTHVQGKLRTDLTAYDALEACFPAGTVSGAPKIRAMEIIAELESEQRGVYAGAAGYFSFSGNMDMAISIRTMVLKDQIAYVQAGCGVVYDSVPEREYQETLNKARALLAATEQAEKLSGGEDLAAPD
jgi:anthranilate synthase component 1